MELKIFNLDRNDVFTLSNPQSRVGVIKNVPFAKWKLDDSNFNVIRKDSTINNLEIDDKYQNYILTDVHDEPKNDKKDSPIVSKDKNDKNKKTDLVFNLSTRDISPTVRERLLSKTGNISELSVELADEEGNFGTPNSRFISFKRIINT